MAQKFGSEFLKEFEDYEPPFLLGRTKRQLVMSVGTFGSMGLSLLFYWLHFPTWLTFIFLGVILVPVFIYGTKKDIEMKERYRFLLTIQKRSFMTDFQQRGEEYKKYDTQSIKGFAEIDQS